MAVEYYNRKQKSTTHKAFGRLELTREVVLRILSKHEFGWLRIDVLGAADE